MRALYLPGLDGEPFCANKIAAHTRDVELHPFTYPSGNVPDWETLTHAVAERLRRLETGLLAGESFGGAVAQQVAIRHPQAVRGLFLVSTFSTERHVFVSAMGRAAVRTLPRRGTALVARGLATWKLAGTLRGEDRRKFLDRFTSVDFEDMARRLTLLRGFNTREQLPGLTMPVDIVYGDKDSIASPADQLRAWARLPDYRLHVLKGLGHLAAAEAPERVAAWMDQWAQRVGA